ncbi:hypothetical protein [Spiroplasma endosymbiont of Atherix ibis]|uniref:hypothetical protein n=1 Tax=Spiroplasma endosymbiont of Atherix ibis TaxID=3066291 RepID=UPI0030CFD9BA
MIEKSYQESMNYFYTFKKNNLSFEQINASLLEITKKYENKYQNEIETLQKKDKKIMFEYSIGDILIVSNVGNNRNNRNYKEAKRLLSGFEKSLSIAQNTLLTLTVVAGIAAAGFFWISIPWAIAAAAIGFYRNKNNLNSSALKAASWALDIRTIASAFKEIVYPILIVSQTTVSSSSWAVPAAFATIGLFATIFSWVSDLSLF